MAHRNSARTSEHGSAIIYVFVGIALFAALMFLFSRGASQNSSGFSKQQSVIKAQAIIQYGDSVANAVTRLVTNGVSENDISFETDIFKSKDGTVLNPASHFPNCINDKCKVFNTKGGKALAQFPADLGSLDPTSPNTFPLRGGLIAHTIIIGDIGTPEPELVLTFHTIPREVCIQINELLNNNFTPDPPTGDYPAPADEYSGTFSLSATSYDSWAEGKAAYCYHATNLTPDMYIYQKVAIAR